MTVSINIFKECLRDVRSHFKSLSNAEVVYDAQGVAPDICRTKNFAEAQILMDGKRYMLCMPLSEEVAMAATLRSVMLHGVLSSVLTRYDVLHEEMVVTDRHGRRVAVDIVLHEIPTGEVLNSYIDYSDPHRLLAAVEALEMELKRVGIVHNNLTAHNIIVGENYELTPIRYHYMERCDDASKGEEEFASLKEWIMTIANIDAQKWEFCSVDKPLVKMLFDGYKYVSNPFEGLVVVQDEKGYFYVNCQNEVMIEGRYNWANDFHEGRAEVELSSGMGLINKAGEYVIPAEYDVVEYCPRCGLSRVRRGDEWGLFNYNGAQILPFEDRYIDDQDLEILSIRG